MAFEKGKKKTGGRVKGAANKKTAILDSFAKDICEGGGEKFKRELMKLSGKQYVDAYMSFFEFVKPKLARTEVKQDLTGEVKITLNLDK